MASDHLKLLGKSRVIECCRCIYLRGMMSMLVCVQAILDCAHHAADSHLLITAVGIGIDRLGGGRVCRHATSPRNGSHH